MNDTQKRPAILYDFSFRRCFLSYFHLFVLLILFFFLFLLSSFFYFFPQPHIHMILKNGIIFKATRFPRFLSSVVWARTLSQYRTSAPCSSFSIKFLSRALRAAFHVYVLILYGRPSRNMTVKPNREKCIHECEK